MLVMAALTSSLPNTPGRRTTATRSLTRSPNSPTPSNPTDAKSSPTAATSRRIRPAGSSVRPAGSSVRPAGSRVRPAGSSVRPAGSRVRPVGSSVRPAGSSVRPAGSSVRPKAPTPPRVRSRPVVPIRPNSPSRPTPSGAARLQTPTHRTPSSFLTTTVGRPGTTVATTATETETVTESATPEVREVGVNGWLAAPTQAPASPLARTEPPPIPDKPGLCEAPKGFGVKCMTRMDQCSLDHHCPGATKCCMVGECGYLCVKPKPTSEAKQPVKQTIKKNKTGLKNEEDAAESRTIEVALEELEEGEEDSNPRQKTETGEGGLTSTSTTPTAGTTTTSTGTSTSTTTSSDVEEEPEDTLESPTQP
ncbi:hypothetical protein Pmani_013531 [Petrolisthes manimaculis]|uniref:WAP domain-containing protein n=1 Tax=Petrolisthes manimaculis TaxID=1843537 RepID=A0AAE1PUQ8_9EUCA|nr:hypothetical protein Pmani_013531 [Petrolisthes manimaculis]